MPHIVINWKTTLMGLGLVAIAASHFLTNGALNQADIMNILAGFGLVAAKDGNAPF